MQFRRQYATWHAIRFQAITVCRPLTPCLSRRNNCPCYDKRVAKWNILLLGEPRVGYGSMFTNKRPMSGRTAKNFRVSWWWTEVAPEFNRTRITDKEEDWLVDGNPPSIRCRIYDQLRALNAWVEDCWETGITKMTALISIMEYGFPSLRGILRILISVKIQGVSQAAYELWSGDWWHMLRGLMEIVGVCTHFQCHKLFSRLMIITEQRTHSSAEAGTRPDQTHINGVWLVLVRICVWNGASKRIQLEHVCNAICEW